MRLKIGDTVRYLNDVGGGVIKRFLSPEMVEITDEDGFDIPVLGKNLVSIDSGEEKLTVTEEEEDFVFEEEEVDVFEEETPIKEDSDIKIYSAIVKDDENYLFYLINDSYYNLFYNILKKTDEGFEKIENGKIDAGVKVNFANLTNSDIFDGLDLVFQIVFLANKSEQLQSPVEKLITYRASKIAKNEGYKENDYFHEDALLTDVFDYSFKSEIEKLSATDINKIIKEKRESEELANKLGTKYKAKTAMPLIEIDLHIHQIIDNYKGMSNTEMLLAQMNEFHTQLKDAITKKAEKIVFIHGVGNGTLKNELRRSLEKEYSRYKYQDASFKEYGFGATLVYIK